MNTSSHSSRHTLALVTLVAGVGGFLFGYDTAVINGANQYLKAHFALSPMQEGMAGASAILGCIPGAMFAGFLSDRFGRRKVLFLCAILYAVSGLLSAIPRTFEGLLAARCISGLGIGASSMICPVYIAELAPAAKRGRLGSLFQLGIVIGIFLTLFVNARIQGLGSEEWNTGWGWRWMLGAEAIPAMVLLGLLFLVPESPRWLLANGKPEEARSVLKMTGFDDQGAEEEMRIIREALDAETSVLGRSWQELLFSFRGRASRATWWTSGLSFLVLLIVGLLSLGLDSELRAGRVLAGIIFGGWLIVTFWISLAIQIRRWHDLGLPAWMVLLWAVPVLGPLAAWILLGFVKGTVDANKYGKPETDLFGELFHARFRLPLIIAVLLMMVSQFSGINAIMYYSTKIFTTAGVGIQDAFQSSVIIGVVNVAFTLVAIALVDRAGRRPLLLVGLAVQVLALGTVGWMFHVGAGGVPLLIGIVVFIAAFGMALGPIPWILCSEIFPTKIRGRAMSLATFTIWTACYIVAQTFPMLNDSPAIGPAKTFWVYAFCSLLGFVFVLTMVPETKGRTLEEIEASWLRK